MSKHRRRDPGREQFWRETVAAWQKSGLSVRAFCRRRGVPQPNFHAWRRTLRKRDAERSAAQPTAFVPLHVVAEARWDIVLPTGLVVRVPATTEAGAVATLVAALRAVSC